MLQENFNLCVLCMVETRSRSSAYYSKLAVWMEIYDYFVIYSTKQDV